MLVISQQSSTTINREYTNTDKLLNKLHLTGEMCTEADNDPDPAPAEGWEGPKAVFSSCQ